LKPIAGHRKFNYVISFSLFAIVMLCLFFSPIAVKAQTDIKVNDGHVVRIPDFPVTSCVFNWYNSNSAIGLQTAGSGNIGSFTAVNNTSKPIIAKITATPRPVPPNSYGISGGYVSVLNGRTNVQIGTIMVPNGTLKLRSKDGITGYFMNNNDIHTLYKVNLLTNQIIATINVPLGIFNVQESPDYGKLYINSREGYNQTNLITVINTSSNTVSNVITLRANASYDGGLMTSDGTKMVFFDQIKSVATIVSLVTNSILFDVPVSRPTDAKLSPDGRYAYITSVFSNILTMVDTNTGDVRSVQLNETPYGLLMSSDGSKIYFPSGSVGEGSVDVVDALALTVTNIPTGKVSGNLYLSPDDKTLYIFDYDTHSAKIGILNLESNKLTIVPVNTQPTEIDDNYYLKYASLVVSLDGKSVYTAITSSSYQRSYLYTYVSVLSTQFNMVIDSIPNGTIPPQFPPGTCSDPITYTITVNPPPPSIFPTGTLAALQTTYGAPSQSTYFSVTAKNVADSVFISAPVGFEISTDNVTFSNTITINSTGVVAPTTIYVRLRSDAPVGAPHGNISLSSGVTTKTIATAVNNEVTGVPLTITAKIINKTYGTTLTSTPGSVDFTADGLMNGEAIGSVTLNYDTGAVGSAITGTYPNSVTPSAPIGGTFLAGNYVITPPVKGDLVVTPAPLTVTAENTERLFGAPNPVFNIKYSGFVNNETTTALTSLSVANTTATVASLNGQYPIIPTGGSAVNYSLIYVPGVLTIDPQPINATNTFTPNNDGVNDTWEIQYISQYPNCIVDIFSRYGERVFHSAGYMAAWDGKQNGANMPVGTYYYVIRLNNAVKPVTGSLTIIR
jgi:gliding motility-associated-like protein